MTDLTTNLSQKTFKDIFEEGRLFAGKQGHHVLFARMGSFDYPAGLGRNDYWDRLLNIYAVVYPLYNIVDQSQMVNIRMFTMHTTDPIETPPESRTLAVEIAHLFKDKVATREQITAMRAEQIRYAGTFLRCRSPENL